MNWYKRSQFVNDNMLAEGIYQRLVQLRDNVMSDANAFDDIHSQGKNYGEIESAIAKAVYKYLNGIGDESMLNEGQRNLVATLRGQMPEQQMAEPPMEPQMQENIDPLNSV